MAVTYHSVIETVKLQGSSARRALVHLDFFFMVAGII